MSPSCRCVAAHNIADCPQNLRKIRSMFFLNQLFYPLQTAGGREAEWAEEPTSLHLCLCFRALLVRQAGYTTLAFQAGTAEMCHSPKVEDGVGFLPWPLPGG